MTIIYCGHSCFKIISQGGRLTVITDPFAKGIGLNLPRLSADIVTVSHEHDDHNNIGSITGEYFVVNGPGEYEVKGVALIGVSTYHDKEKGAKRGLTTVYVIQMDNIRVCHLGDLGQERLNEKELEAIGEVDILMIPVGGAAYTISAKEAVKIANQIEPKIIIPMHYKLPGLTLELEPIDNFLQEMGVDKKVLTEKLVVKKKDLVGKEMEVVIMKS